MSLIAECIKGTSEVHIIEKKEGEPSYRYEGGEIHRIKGRGVWWIGSLFARNGVEPRDFEGATKKEVIRKMNEYLVILFP